MYHIRYQQKQKARARKSKGARARYIEDGDTEKVKAKARCCSILYQQKITTTITRYKAAGHRASRCTTRYIYIIEYFPCTTGRWWVRPAAWRIHKGWRGSRKDKNGGEDQITIILNLTPRWSSIEDQQKQQSKRADHDATSR